MKRFIIPVIIIVLLVAGFFVFQAESDTVQEVVVSDAIQDIIKQDSTDAFNKTQEQKASDTIPNTITEPVVEETEPVRTDSFTVQSSVQLDIPFIVQAPNANWDLPYKEACEEASLMMVHAYYQGEKSFTQDEMQAAIDSIIFWGNETFNTFDTSAETTTRYLTEKLGYDQDRVQVLYDFTIEDIKALLSEGIPVIVPAAGRELGNKFFQDPGPLYHMLVITGYTDDEFITNDPGTRRGEDYRYDQEVLYNAIHDLTEDLEAISTGRKAMIIIQP